MFKTLSWQIESFEGFWSLNAIGKVNEFQKTTKIITMVNYLQEVTPSPGFWFWGVGVPFRPWNMVVKSQGGRTFLSVHHMNGLYGRISAQNLRSGSQDETSPEGYICCVSIFSLHFGIEPPNWYIHNRIIFIYTALSKLNYKVLYKTTKQTKKYLRTSKSNVNTCIWMQWIHTVWQQQKYNR